MKVTFICFDDTASREARREIEVPIVPQPGMWLCSDDWSFTVESVDLNLDSGKISVWVEPEENFWNARPAGWELSDLKDSP
jgi:hypothetical protein